MRASVSAAHMIWYVKTRRLEIPVVVLEKFSVPPMASSPAGLALALP